MMISEVNRVYEENLSVYGARKVWRQLNRENIMESIIDPF